MSADTTKEYQFVTKEEIDRLEIDLNDATWFGDARVVQKLLAERDAYREVAKKFFPSVFNTGDHVDDFTRRLLEKKSQGGNDR